jgi:hypothetical protein
VGWNPDEFNVFFLFGLGRLEFCKFIYPPEELQAFQHAKLGVYVAVAFEISAMEGKSSFRNYQGVSRSDISPELASKCRQIVTLFGGAKTKTAMAMRVDILADANEMNELHTALDTGLPMNDAAQEGPSEPV